MTVEYRHGRRVDQCDECGRFGAKRYVEDRGPNGLGGRQTFTYYACDRCENKRREEAAKNTAKK